MGSGIAQVAAMAGYTTFLYDVDAAMVQKAREGIEKSLTLLKEKNKLSSPDQTAILSRISYQSGDGLEDCRADLVIEAIVEKPEIKGALFMRLAAINGSGTIFASNTSSLSLTTLAEKIPYPERFAGLHFFNPAPVMKLVEVVHTPLTNEKTKETLIAVARQMGKTPVSCKDAPGFIVNHVARPYYLEALHLVEEGLADFTTVDQIMEATGFRMGPFRLMDLIGNDINYTVSCLVYEAMGRPERLKPSPIQEAQVQQGALGRKTGKGYYRYEQ
jgi:3-hydroxybutyryl-CoA dehydrogenase